MQLSQQLGVEEKVKFLGYLKKEEIRAELDKSDIFVLVSYRETFGIAYVEALARGLPIIHTQGEGIDGFFAPSEIGYAVPPTCINEVQNALIKIMSDYEAMSLRCREAAYDFSWEKVANTYFELYSAI